MKIVHPDRTYQVRWVSNWLEHREKIGHHAADQIVREARLCDNDGTELSERVARRVRNRLLGIHAQVPEPLTFGEHLREHQSSGGVRFLIPGLWPWGTYPSLGGNPKAGKSTLVVDLVASLVTPGRRFLDHFEEATFTEEERAVWLINTEMEGSVLTDELWNAGVTENSPLMVTHLRDHGGPRAFDLTDPVVYDEWVEQLVYCEKCDGSDDMPHSVVIVDNLTAVLQDTGQSLERYGELHGKFVQLMTDVDCPNGLTVIHNTLSGTHAMGGATGQNRPDGLWNFWSANNDNPTAPRYFNVVARMGGVSVPTTRVERSPEGRLTLGNPRQAATEPDQGDPVRDVAKRVAAYVAARPGVDGQALTDNVEAGSKADSLAGRARAVESGWIIEKACGSGCDLCERPHHRRTHYWPVTT